MKKKSKAVPKIDPYVDGLMGKLLERLVSLERKMDSVVSHVSRLASAGGSQPKTLPAPQAQPQPVRRERMMYEAICADCSKVCEVPFKPTEDRAVYCKACWGLRKGLPVGRQGGPSSRPGMPILRPVALPPKPTSQLSLPVRQAGAAAQAAVQAKEESRKTRKNAPAKKPKKKKK